MSNKGYNNNNTYVTSGISFFGLLQIAFIVLKLCGVIDWSWWLVLLPVIIEAGITVIFILTLVVIAIVMKIKEDREWKEHLKKVREKEKKENV